MIDRFELVEKIESLNRIRKVLNAIDMHISSIVAWLEEVEFYLRHEERSITDED